MINAYSYELGHTKLILFSRTFNPQKQTGWQVKKGGKSMNIIIKPQTHNKPHKVALAKHY